MNTPSHVAGVLVFGIVACASSGAFAQAVSPSDDGLYVPIPAERGGLPSQRTVAGNVLDEDGKPVSGATVRPI